MKIKPIYLTLLTGILAGISWPETGSLVPLIFIAFVPMLFMEEQLTENGGSPRKVFWYSYLGFFVWNLISTWWIYHASLSGAVMAILFNSFFMAYVFMMYSKMKTRFGLMKGLISFPIFWLGFEYLHYNWDLSYPWLSIGNVFSGMTSIVQWYEYTGIFGGSLWVCIITVTIFMVLKQLEQKRAIVKSGVFLSIMVLAPLIWSFAIDTSYSTDQTINVVAAQPNIDPYVEKYGPTAIPAGDQLYRFFDLANSAGDDSVDFFVAPETFIPYPIRLHKIEKDGGIKLFKQFASKFPNAMVVTGITSVKFYKAGEETRPTTRAREDGSQYDYFNSAIQLGGTATPIYHKSKLVLGTEMMPFPWLFRPFQELIFDLGGTTGSLGTQDTRTVFSNQKNEAVVAPVICWESVYGEFVGEFCQQGANVIFVITNDAWWQNTPGHRQHLLFSKLRAIESRRAIARSANTGISCFIMPDGELIQPTNYEEQTVIRASIPLNNELTFYSAYGDFIGRVASFLAVGLLVYLIAAKLKEKNA